MEAWSETGLRLAVIVFLVLVGGIAGLAQLSVDTHLSSHIFTAGENRTYSMIVRGVGNATPRVEPQGGLSNISSVREAPSRFAGMSVFDVVITAPPVTQERVFSGSLLVTADGSTESVPVTVNVLPTNRSDVQLEVNFASDTLNIGRNPRVHLRLSRQQSNNETLTVNYRLRRSATGEEVLSLNRSYTFVSQVSDIVTMPLNGTNVSEGSYYVQAYTIYNRHAYTDLDTIRVIKPFWGPTKTRLAVFIVVAGLVGIGGWKGYKWYQRRKQEEARYVFPVDYNQLPGEGEDNYWVGKIAETSKQAYVDPSDLTTHAIVSGSTGSGKSVTGSVIVEEALERDVPVVVFDPTAQWTGFVKKCVDENLLEHYERFDMDPDDDPHPYKGLIKKLDADNLDIDFEELMNPGEVTVFTLNHLSTEEFDEVVRQIIDAMFEVDWEESAELELVVVFDEVHRLLEKYGGQGGYHALERGAREFRKWGIGLVMASQVTADFKQAVSGNIMTEFQLQTKSMEDIERVKTKYGNEFAKRITSQDVGVGMIQNPEYNDGNPWFVDFRPTYHNPHKIPEEELEQYYEFTDRLDRIRATIKEMEESGEDVYDEKLEMRLSSDKLKEGRFRMAEMYIDSLEDKLGIGGED